MDKHLVTIETYNKSAVAFQNKFMDMDLYNDTYDKFCSFIEIKEARILEIACGPGNITRYLLRKRPDFKILAIDLAEKMIDLARINNPAANFRVMDCRKIDQFNEQFDAIMGGFCMPYLSDQECGKLIRDASKLLNQNGVLYLSTMEDDCNKSGFETTSFSGSDKVYIYYHQSEFIINELKANGFMNIDVQRKNYPESNGTFTTDLIIIARK
jgi:2-polyprenyl-3-methyl-5-hydroxy-6-metoxy-1,4-benzoquinol methylase